MRHYAIYLSKSWDTCLFLRGLLKNSILCNIVSPRYKYHKKLSFLTSEILSEILIETTLKKTHMPTLGLKGLIS